MERIDPNGFNLICVAYCASKSQSIKSCQTAALHDNLLALLSLPWDKREEDSDQMEEIL